MSDRRCMDRGPGRVEVAAQGEAWRILDRGSRQAEDGAVPGRGVCIVHSTSLCNPVYVVVNPSASSLLSFLLSWLVLLDLSRPPLPAECKVLAGEEWLVCGRRGGGHRNGTCWIWSGTARGGQSAPLRGRSPTPAWPGPTASHGRKFGDSCFSTIMLDERKQGSWLSLGVGESSLCSESCQANDMKNSEGRRLSNRQEYLARAKAGVSSTMPAFVSTKATLRRPSCLYIPLHYQTLPAKDMRGLAPAGLI